MIKDGQATTVNSGVPDPTEKVWVVLVCNVETKYDEDKTCYFFQPDYPLSPKGGGPASLLDPKTWSDKGLAETRAKMVEERFLKERIRSRGGWLEQAAAVAFVDDEHQLHWQNGALADRPYRAEVQQ